MAKAIGEVRPSQLISTFGPGAILDLPTLSVTVAGLEHWDVSDIDLVDEPRLLKVLNINRIYSPPVKDRPRQNPTIPAMVFPRYLLCPLCRRLEPCDHFQYDESEGEYVCKDGNCTGKGKAVAIPARFLVACSHGHMDDFPYGSYLHAGSGTCSSTVFKLRDSGRTGSIYDLTVECAVCGKKRNMGDAFLPGQSPVGACTRERPWLGQGATDAQCNAPVRVLLRGASNLWFPVVKSALSIPPFSSNIHVQLGKVASRISDKVDSPQKLEMWLDMTDVPELEGFTPKQLWEALQQRRSADASEENILYGEWLKLRAEYNAAAKEEFETHKEPVPDPWTKWLDGLYRVERLKEVRVLRGFTRIDPLTLGAVADEDSVSEQPQIAPLSQNPQIGWLPGVVVRGEGIFLELSEKKLLEWEEWPSTMRAAGHLTTAHKRWLKDRKLPEIPFPGVRYVLLHTLSHALMRQLGLECGYSSTALRERIYCATGKNPMAGILIYTASADSEGSLGGLVELGRTQRFGDILLQALRELTLCSADPLCSEHAVTGRSSLNGAACHACTMAAETSCERSNSYLDRSLVVPTLSVKDVAFFKDATLS
jgi:hypothetical protein